MYNCSTPNLALKLERVKSQFITIRNFKNITWDNIEPLLNKNEDLNALFSFTEPDDIKDK